MVVLVTVHLTTTPLRALCAQGGHSASTVGASAFDGKVYFQVCGASTDKVVFYYCSSGSSSCSESYPKKAAFHPNGDVGVWKSGGWTKGNPSYGQRITVNGVALPRTDETKALAVRPLTCEPPIPNITHRDTMS